MRCTARPSDVEGQKVDRHLGGDLEAGRPVLGHVDGSPDLFRRVGGTAGDQRKLVAKRRVGGVALAGGHLVNQRRERALLDLLNDTDLLYVAALNGRFESLINVLQDDRRPVARHTPVCGQLHGSVVVAPWTRRAGVGVGRIA